jgi:hypothetical protein
LGHSAAWKIQKKGNFFFFFLKEGYERISRKDGLNYLEESGRLEEEEMVETGESRALLEK